MDRERKVALIAQARREELAEVLSAYLEDFLISERLGIIAKFKATRTLTMEELSELRIELNLLDKFHNLLMSKVADAQMTQESLKRIGETEERYLRELDAMW